MARIGFVILHYNVIEETIKCIESIQRLNGYEHCFIVVVDNASPNKTGKILRDKYNEDKQIIVILRDKNDGFSRGNNEGCAYAIKYEQPDFLVVANNDIIFEQSSFIDDIVREYELNEFDILGPDVYNPIRQNHQSPIALKPPTKTQVSCSIMLNGLVVHAYPLVYPVMKKYYRKLESSHDMPGYDEYSENVCLHGSCMIYSKNYFIGKERIFEPETDFYYEEFLQALWCKHTNKKVVYQPKLRVCHMQGRSTATTVANQKERILFRTKNILKSAVIYKRYLIELQDVAAQGK